MRIEPVPIVDELMSVDQHFEVSRDGERLRIPATPLCATGKKS